MGKRKQIASTFSLKILYFFTFLAICTFVLFSIRGLHLPYVGYNAWNYNTYSLIAHNYNKFGWYETKLAPIISVSENLPTNPEYYLHHPPLISITLALFFSFFGESFATGRLTVIFFSVLSIIPLFGVGYQLRGKIFALISSIVYCLLPASILFGRMIGQESLVLFFALSLLFFVLRYNKTKAVKYLLLSLFTTIVGVLSDWPMIYFVGCLALWLWFVKEKKLAISLITIAAGIGFFYLMYIYRIMGSYEDLLQAISTRSLGQLTALSFWPLKWIVTIVTRLFFYFNPFIVSGLIITSFLLYKKLSISKGEKILLFSLLLWGLLHIILFPEGSFGHPYWIYYLLPSIVFFTSYLLTFFFDRKFYISLLILFIVSLGYAWKVEDWKTKEITGNVWRYDLGQLVSLHIPPYSSFILHPSSPVDYDLLRYEFKYNIEIKNEEMITGEDRGKELIYICNNVCDENTLAQLNHNPFQKYNNSDGELYIFTIDSKYKKNNEQTLSTPNDSKQIRNISIHPIKRLYLFILEKTSMPQL